MKKKDDNGIPRQPTSYLIIKRMIDIVVSFVALICFSPIFLGVYVLNSVYGNRGPLLYKQIRIGKNHKAFKIYKFRSMIVNADKVLHENPELYQKYLKNNYKLEPDEDPRITKIGKWLRKSSVDEIPQFINILAGTMSLIGPRPVVEEELHEYGDCIDKFLSVKPGAMGIWQASGRSNIGYPQRAELELSYVDDASLVFDAKIFVKNVISIFKSTGAY